MRKILVILLVTIILFASGCSNGNNADEPSQVSQTSEIKDDDIDDLLPWQKAYYYLLKDKYLESKGKYDNDYINPFKYELCDLNNDSVPELIFCRGNYTHINNLFTFADNKAVNLEFNGGSEIKYNKFRSLIMSYSIGASFSTTTIFEIKNAELQKKTEFTSSKYGFNIDHKACDSNTYYSEYDKYSYMSWEKVSPSIVFNWDNLVQKLKSYKPDSFGEKTWIEAYPEFLVGMIDEYSGKGEYKFGLADIDGDNTPELFVTSLVDNEKSLAIYSIYENSIITLWTTNNQDMIKYNPKNRCLFIETKNSYICSSYCLFKKGMDLLPEKVYKYVFKAEKDSRYTLNRKAITSEEYYKDTGDIKGSEDFVDIPAYILDNYNVFSYFFRF